MDSFIALCFLKAPDPGRQDLYEEVGRENTILISTVEIDKTKPNDHLFTLLLTARSNQELCSLSSKIGNISGITLITLVPKCNTKILSCLIKDDFP